MNLLMTADEIKTAIGPERVANLEKLADYLESGELRAEFDMAEYAEAEYTTALSKCAHCGTVGCMVGHGPYAGIKKRTNEHWLDYSRRVFVYGGDVRLYNLWHWLFDSDWRCNDNTPTGGAARIRWALTHGLPANYGEQIWGGAPLCYRSESCQT